MGLRSGVAFCLLVSLAVARGQFSFSDQNAAASVSGQIQVSSSEAGAPALRVLPPPGTNILQLKTALLAVSAERFKTALWHQLGLPPNASWSGKIYLRLHPAAAYDETVAIVSGRFLDHWNYRVDLPDMLSKNRYARALSGVLLLELANRATGRDGRAAEIPAWLVDGLAQEVLATDGDQVAFSAPRKKGGDLAVNRINQSEKGLDSLAGARRILQNTPALTFDQLSWPTGAQMEGDDGGVYLASAQLFQSELLELKNGREKMRAMLAELPAHLNWQTAFFHAFGADFQRPLDVEKWWALRVIDFGQHTSGPRWTTEVSAARLNEVLLVPVETRGAANRLPARSEVSLQAALKTLQPASRDEILRLKERDLALMEIRLAPPFGELAEGYRLALAEFLGDSQPGLRPSRANKHGVPGIRAGLPTTLRRLDLLDARRRAVMTKTVIPLPGLR